MTVVELSPAAVDAVARRVVALLAAGTDAASPLIDASEVARRFGVTRSWAYDNAGRLGAVRLGAGPKARLRFAPDRVAHALAATDTADEPTHQPGPSARAPRRRQPDRATHTAAGAPLLTIKEPPR